VIFQTAGHLIALAKAKPGVYEEPMTPIKIVSSAPVSVLKHLNPLSMTRNLYDQRDLIKRFAWRDVVGRYKGSFLGIIWSFITPLVMLSVYAFVFSVILRAKWGAGSGESQIEFALTLFCGLLVFNIFAESVSMSSGLILAHSNYVKKVVFPLEVLPVATMCSSLIHAAIGVGILVPALLVFKGTLPVSICLFPLVLLPICAFTLGLSWFFSSLGVFMRDVGYPISVAVQVLLFISGVFFPLSAVPQQFQFVVKLNPLAILLEDARRTVMWGQFPNWNLWLLMTLFSLAVMQMGYAWFMKSKGAFSDVI
jgi:lipopolysaccharide transport system permease protein